LNFGVESGDRWLDQGAGPGAGVKMGLPKDLIGHPVANARKEFLQQQQGF